jgi:hypothetical protein
VALVEDGDNVIAGLEELDVFADGNDCAGTIGAGDDASLEGEGVLALGDDEIAVLDA